MRIQNLRSRVANLERFLGQRVRDQSTDFDRRVTLWLVHNLEYRRVTREIFERMCEADEAPSQEVFEAVVTAEERDLILRLTAQAEAFARAELSQATVTT